LRPYQLGAIAGVESQWERGTKRTLLVLPTGTGKTVVFAELVRRRVAAGRRMLVLAHRTELLEQARDKLTAVGVWAAIEQAEKRAGFAPVVVASVQTLKGKRLAALDPKSFDVVIDEAHHAYAASYRAILKHFDDSLVLGVTATPDRGDGKALGEIFASVAYRYEMRDAIRDKFLAPLVARRIVVDGIDLSSVRSRAGDLASDELSEIMAAEQAVHGVVAPLLEQAAARRTIVFAVDVAHARALAEVLCRHKAGCARVAHGELDALERKRVLADYRAGEFQFLVNCALYTEGFDEPSIECVAVVRPTKSRALYVQMVGRGTRLHPGKAELLLLDFTGNAGKHKLVGPIDALAAGEVTDEQRSEANRMLAGEQRELDGLLEAADAELKRRRERHRLTVGAKYFTSDVDPFFGEEELGPPIAEAWALEVASQRQRHLLEEAGFKKLPLGLTKGEATRMLAAIALRHERGLATFKQVKLLNGFGIDARALTKQQATTRIGILANSGWSPAALHRVLPKLLADELLASGKAVQA
jgi:superfamily II DNA or RNA helicase